jgi:hypothetical protein
MKRTYHSRDVSLENQSRPESNKPLEWESWQVAPVEMAVLGEHRSEDTSPRARQSFEST